MHVAWQLGTVTGGGVVNLTDDNAADMTILGLAQSETALGEITQYLTTVDYFPVAG